MWEPRHLAALERAVGGRLFDRLPGARPPQLTPLGRLVLEEGRALLARQAGAADAVDRFLAGGGRVDVGTFQTVTHVLLPDVLRRVREEQPDARILLSEEESDPPPLDGLDLVFFDGDGPPGSQQAEVFRDEHVLLTPTGTLVPDGPVPLAVLDGLAMVALPTLCDQAHVEAALAARGIAPDVVFRTADNQGVTSMVRAGLGSAVMPLQAVAGQLDAPGLDVHELEPGLPDRVVNLLWQGSLSPLATRFRDIALEVGSALPTAAGCLPRVGR